MVIFRVERLLAGTAIAIALSMTGTAGHAQSGAKSDGVPIPEPATIAPLTPADVAPVPAPRPTAADTTSAQPKAAETKPDQAQPTDTTAGIAPAKTKPAEAKPAESTAEAKPADVKAPDSAKATASTPAPVPAATATADAGASSAVTEKLRDLFTSKLDRPFLNRGDRSGAEAFYSARKFAPVWTTDAGPNEQAKAAIAYLEKIGADGLDPADYPIPSFKPGMDAAALADAEAKLTASILAYTRHASTGRLAYSRVSADIYYALQAPDAKDVLSRVSQSKNVAAALDSYEPQHPQYKALKAQLAKARAAADSKDHGPAPIPTGVTVKWTKTGTTDPRVPALRERLGLAAKPGDLTYDKELAIAVARFQKAHDLKADGHLGNATVAAINGPKRERLVDTLIVNLERWRWVPRDLGAKRVILNIPDYTLRVYNGNAQVWMTKVVVGKPGKHATPLLSETMKYITVNPTWNVPPSIVYGEYLPALQQDPTVLDRMGFKLAQNADGGVRIWQPPGDGNALGRIRFNFPNKFLVYQHDTPEKQLFSRFPRAYSHGCMRVENPPKYAEVILGLANPKDGYTIDKIRSMYGPSEIDIKLQTYIPVHITYQTAFVDENGKLELRDDVYGRDAAMIAALKPENRKVADVPVDHPPENYSHPPATLPPGVPGAYAGNNGFGNDGPNFFEMLFGGGRQAAPQAANTGRRGRPVRQAVNRDIFSW